MEILCGCKGVRSCLMCEKPNVSVLKTDSKDKELLTFKYCKSCGLCWPSEEQRRKIKVSHPFILKGIQLVDDFVSEAEEQSIVDQVDLLPWMPSQSGRRKQDFGPKVNFKKRKVKCEAFKGFPCFVNFVIERLTSLQSLADFKPVELCNLEYCSDRGSAIDPHLDDEWLWGERLVTLNLLSSTTLTLSLPYEINTKCDCVSAWTHTHEQSLVSDESWNITDHDCLPSHLSLMTDCGFCEQQLSSTMLGQKETRCTSANGRSKNDGEQNEGINDYTKFEPEVRIELPARSFLVLSNCARHHWFHGIKREDIGSRRLAMTLRELSLDFLEGGKECKIGNELLLLSKQNFS